MPEPLSILTGVVSLLKASYELGVELKKFCDVVATVRDKIDGLLKDVKRLSAVLESMRETFEGVTAEYGTGYVASHWRNIACALEDGSAIVSQLQRKLDNVNKAAKILDGPRKQIRLNNALEDIMHTDNTSCHTRMAFSYQCRP